jgi:predicted nucleic acid-binding protein
VSTRIYLDANVFIYFVEGELSIAEPLRALFQALRQKPLAAVTSELTLAETLAPPRRIGALPLHVKRRLYLDLINSKLIQLVPVDRDILIETADLRQAARHNLADAIHIVSAMKSQCGYFLSGDADGKRLPAQMKWISPDRQGLQVILEALA